MIVILIQPVILKGTIWEETGSSWDKYGHDIDTGLTAAFITLIQVVSMTLSSCGRAEVAWHISYSWKTPQNHDRLSGESALFIFLLIKVIAIVISATVGSNDHGLFAFLHPPHSFCIICLSLPQHFLSLELFLILYLSFSSLSIPSLSLSPWSWLFYTIFFSFFSSSHSHLFHFQNILLILLQVPSTDMTPVCRNISN